MTSDDHECSHEEYYDADDFEELAVQAQYNLGWGDPAMAVRQCELLVEHFSETDGPESPRAFVWRSMLGRALTDARHYPEAEAVLAALVVDRTRVQGPDAPGTLVARGNLARAVAFGGRPREGILLAERLLADRERLVGPRHPSVLDTRGHLAHFHHHLGDHTTAVAMFTELLADRECFLRKDHESIAETRTNLAVATVRADPLAVDLDCGIDVIFVTPAEPKVLDPTLVALDVIAIEILTARARYSEALDRVTAVIDACDDMFGPSAPPTLDAIRAGAKVLVAMGNRADAITALTAAIDIAETGETTDTLAALACRAELVDLLVCRLVVVHGEHPDVFADLVADVAHHQQILAAAAHRFEPEHRIRCITDDAADLLWAIEDGAWDREAAEAARWDDSDDGWESA